MKLRNLALGLNALALTVILSCVRPVPPTPTPIPTPVVEVMHAVIRDMSGKIPEQIQGAIGTDAWTSECKPISYYMLECKFPEGVHYGDTVSVDFSAKGLQHYFGKLALVADLNVFLPPSWKALPGLRAEGQHFRQLDGSRITIKGSTDFNAYARFLAGEDISSVFQQRADFGYNYIRVFTGYNVDHIGRLVPREHADFYSRIPEFLHLAANYNLYVEFVGFSGPYVGIFDSDAEKIQHWELLIVAVQGETNALLELVNEYDNIPNIGLPLDRLRRPTGVLASHGSAIQDGRPLEPFWDYVTFHPASGSDWWRKPGHNAMEIWNGPTISDETTRFPDNDNNPSHAYDMGQTCELLSAGCVFHSVAGKISGLWVGEAVAARAFSQGADSLPLDCQDGAYKNLTQGDNDPRGLRVYQRGNDPACIGIAHRD